jgi:hypothetical protein
MIAETRRRGAAAEALLPMLQTIAVRTMKNFFVFFIMLRMFFPGPSLYPRNSASKSRRCPPRCT